MTLALVAEPLPASQAVLELFEDYGRLVEHLGQDGRRVGYQLGVNRDAAAVLREHDRATGLLRSRVGADQDAPRDLHRFGCHASGRHRSEIVALEIRVRATLRELHQADAQCPELVHDRDIAAQALTRILDTTKRVSAQVDAIEADGAVDRDRRLTAGIAPSVMD